jgi:hypothetical protein
MTLADGAAGRTARPGRQYAEVACPPLFPDPHHGAADRSETERSERDAPVTLRAIEERARYLSSLQGRLELNEQPEFRDTLPEPLTAKENQ